MDKNVLIIYKSKTGMTKKYAEWLGEMIPAEVIPFEKRNSADDGKYSIILYGGGFYAGGINGLGWMKSKLKDWHGKKIIVFATGATPQDSPDVIKAFQQNFSQEELDQIKTFYLRAGICYERLGKKDQILMKMFNWMIRKQQGDSEMVKTTAKSFDFSEKPLINPILEYIETIR